MFPLCLSLGQCNAMKEKGRREMNDVNVSGNVSILIEVHLREEHFHILPVPSHPEPENTIPSQPIPKTFFEKYPIPSRNSQFSSHLVPYRFFTKTITVIFIYEITNIQFPIQKERTTTAFHSGLKAPVRIPFSRSK